MQRGCYYSLLGVGKDATRARIRRAYLDLAKQTHPDKHHGSKREGAATVAFERIQKAYKVLSDPDQRRAYDKSQAEAARPLGGGNVDEATPEANAADILRGRYNRANADTAPPMTWKQYFRIRSFQKKYKQFSDQKSVSLAKPVLAVVGIFAVCRTVPSALIYLTQEEAAEAAAE
eukprot:TRINITY_DN33049_c0_g1_i2.p1 TRINITY_DN33049_c0_g1~~TRINITY_DN33049_c0_g1_i2.p1  ORF type:complete len:175 (+),score=48.40 TRINITY_DN33049_c0_g1_i2:101-625(+)